MAVLASQGKVVRVSADVVFSSQAYEQMVERIVGRLNESGKITVADVRDMFGASRKYALPLLEYMDQQRITRPRRRRAGPGEEAVSLDLVAAMAQIEALADRMRDAQEARAARLAQTRAALAQSTAYSLVERAGEAQGRFVFPYADPLDDPARRHPRPDVPTDYSVIAADGSHIDVDRHLPVRCFLINIGLCRMVYGAEPDAHLDHAARLYTEPEELSIVDPESPLNSYALEGPLLGIKRSVDEVAALADAVGEASADVPVLLLVDGSLVLWPLGGEGPPPGRFPAYVRRVLLEEGFLRSLERLRQAAIGRTIVPAAYISLPGSREVAASLRLALCPHTPVGDCGRHCRAIEAGQRACDAVQGFTDRELYADSLAPGERTTLFGSRAAVVRDHYGDHHRIRFFYLNVGRRWPAWRSRPGSPTTHGWSTWSTV